MLEDLTVRKAVEFAIKTEELGAGFYGRLAAESGAGDELREVFATLARDEVAHGQRFAALRDRLPDGGQPVTKDLAAYLRAVALSSVFSEAEGPHGDPAKIGTRLAALGRAFELEKTTLLYYEGMRDALGANEILDAIIAEEKRHVVKVMEYLITDAKMRGLDDRHP